MEDWEGASQHRGQVPTGQAPHAFHAGSFLKDVDPFTGCPSMLPSLLSMVQEFGGRKLPPPARSDALPNRGSAPALSP